MAVKKFERMLVKILTLYFFVTTSVSECPQVSFDSASVHYCASKCIDRVTLYNCVGPENVPRDTYLVEIFSKLTVLRRGYIHDLPKLTYIFTVSNDIIRINPGAFLNLPKLDMVFISNSRINEILWGVFNNTSISDLALNKNFISLIEPEAFSNMPNLKVLDLNSNRLTTYNKNWLTNSHKLEEIHLAYNQIEVIPMWAFDIFPNLKHVDLSFNLLIRLEAFIFNNVKKLDLLDLTANQLWTIPYFIFKSRIEVDELRVPLNQLVYLPNDLLVAGKFKSLVLHPNPWKCPCLERIKYWMSRNNAILKSITGDPRIRYHSGFPECAPNTKDSIVCFEMLGVHDYTGGPINYTNWFYEPFTRPKPECTYA